MQITGEMGNEEAKGGMNKANKKILFSISPISPFLLKCFNIPCRYF
jgi:hypothetical protein